MAYISLKEKTYHYIKNKILSGEYAPGQPLDERQIIEELQISRTPYREAINALSKENLVDIYPNRGMFVKQISIEDVSEVFDIRCLLEPYMLQSVCDLIPDTVLNDLSRRNSAATLSDQQSALEEDDYFHLTMLQYVPNRQLVRIMENLYDCNRLRILLKNGSLVVKEALDEHQEIIDALKKRDPELAAEKMKMHLVNSKARAMQALLGNL